MLKTYEDKSTWPSVLTPALADFYGGGLGFPEVASRPYVIGNFVQAVDGPVTFGKGNANPLFAHPMDRLLMSVLRAMADAVVVGKETLMDDPPKFTWHWKTMAPPGTEGMMADFAKSLGKKGPQKNVFVSARGTGFDFSRKVFRDADVQAVIATTSAGAEIIKQGIAALAQKPAVEVWQLDDGKGGVDLKSLLKKLHEAGCRLVLTEGGPALYGSFEKEDLIDEIFLTQRPMIVGNGKDAPRPTFSAYSHAPGAQKSLSLVSVKKSEDDVLFLRWKYDK